MGREDTVAENLITCENCGAEIDIKEPRCPYCDSFLYEGAEQEYWDKMGKIHEDLKDLEDVPEQAYKREVKAQTRKVGGVLKRGMILLLVCAGLWMLFSGDRRAKDVEDKKSQMVWQQENFPKLDAWYEAGEYDEIIAVRHLWAGCVGCKPVQLSV